MLRVISVFQLRILNCFSPQLRPSANVYDLAKNFNLEVSLFERLIKVNIPFIRLNHQVSGWVCVASDI